MDHQSIRKSSNYKPWACGPSKEVSGVKSLVLNNPSYRYLVEAFGQWLDTLGFSAHQVYHLPIKVREMLHYLEGRGVDKINKVSEKDLQQYYYSYLSGRANQRRGGGLSAHSLNGHQYAIRKFMEYLRQVGRMDAPIPNFRNEATESRLEVLTGEQIAQLFKAASISNARHYKEVLADRDRAMLAIFYGCGLRRSEGIALDIKDLNFDTRILHVRKGKGYKERLVPVPVANLKYLQRWVFDSRPAFLKNSETAFFLSQRGQRITGQSMLLRLKSLILRTENPELTGREIGLHTLRHAIATHLLEAGMELESISRFLGHSSLESTQVYTHLITEDEAL